METELYIYGSENPKDNGKMHVADENGMVLCGASITWGECTGVITHIENKRIWAKPFSGHHPKSPSSEVLHWEDVKCKRCAKKINC